MDNGGAHTWRTGYVVIVGDELPLPKLQSRPAARRNS
jgi:hypothetical protein